MIQTFEFIVVDCNGKKHSGIEWTGNTMEHAAKRLLDCKFPGGKVIAWRYPPYVVTTSPMRAEKHTNT